MQCPPRRNMYARGQSRMFSQPAPSRRKPTTGGAITTAEEDPSRDNFDRVATIAREAYAIGKEILGELNVEEKVIVTGPSVFNPDYNGGGSVLLNSCAQGVTDATRTGDSIKLSNLKLNWYGTCSTAGLYIVRCIVWWQPGADNLSLAFPTTVSSQDGLMDFAMRGTYMAPLCPKDYDNENKSMILYDETFTFELFNNAVRFLSPLIKIDRHTVFENNSTTINNGVLRVAWISNVAATANMQIGYNAYVYFVDN